MDGHARHESRPGEGEHHLFAFLTCEPNEVVAPIHPKAMPVILTTPDEYEAWMTAPIEEALRLQRKLPDGTLSRRVGQVAARKPAPPGPLFAGLDRA